MDALIWAAARALATGDPLGALNHVALRDDPSALALRGIAMAQLGDYPRARKLLKLAGRRFGSREVLARARCDVALAEVALVMRDLDTSPRALATAVSILEAHGDAANALQARLIAARRLLLVGRLADAATALARLDTHGLPPALAAIAEVTTAELELRSLCVTSARASLARAREAAARSGVAALRAEVEEVYAALDRPAARCVVGGVEHTLRLEEIAAMLASGDLVIDACRRGLRAGADGISLARRPILFALLRALAESWPGGASRDALIASAFHARHPDETHRARLRVEIGRLRKLIVGQATIEATSQGFVLVPSDGRAISILEPPIAGEQASLLALLADGTAWSTSALALALDASQRTVQRALVDLESAGQVRSIGRARAQRWVSPPLTEFTTLLLLPGTLVS